MHTTPTTKPLTKALESTHPNAPIASEKMVVGRKVFFLDLKENNRGRFLKVTEDVSGRRDTIMIPAEALEEFHQLLGRLIQFEAKLPLIEKSRE